MDLSYVQVVEVMEGAVVGLILYCLVSMAKAPEFLKRGVVAPRPIQYALASAGAVGFGVFWYALLFDLLYAESRISQYILLFHAIPSTNYSAVCGLVLCCLCVGVFRTKRGISEGLRFSVMFGALVVFAMQLLLLVFDSKEMYLHVTYFAAWSWGGVDLLSNWFVLIVSASFLAILVSADKGNGGPMVERSPE